MGEAPMEYVRLGKTGLRVSRIALGCMSYGEWSSCGLEFVEKVLPTNLTSTPSTARTRRSGTLACCFPTRVPLVASLVDLASRR
jgi:aryl-alcohol dehydrogenase-like predicted oxidoreductase